MEEDDDDVLLLSFDIRGDINETDLDEILRLLEEFEDVILERIIQSTFEMAEYEPPKPPHRTHLHFKDYNFVKPHKCAICWEERNWIYQPTGCLCKIDICNECVRRLSSCPTCRNSIASETNSEAQVLSPRD